MATCAEVRREVARRNVIVTGGGGGEKTAVAHAIVSAHSATHAPVALDAYRYVDAHWTKAPAAEFRERVATRMSECLRDHPHWVLATKYNDAHDPEQARIAIVRGLIESAPNDAKPVLVRIKTSQKEHLQQIVTRSLGRASGEIPQGACPETAESVTEMIVKFYESYVENVAALDELERFAAAQGCIVVSGALAHVVAVCSN
jgi:hypothetical protein